VGTFPVDGRLKQCQIAFCIEARVGPQQGMVVHIDRTGRADYYKICDQRYAVKDCLLDLQNIGYNICTYSSMRIASLNVGLHHYIGLFCAQLAEANKDDVVILITYNQINCYDYIYPWC
jgi:hypothetical protein